MRLLALFASCTLLPTCAVAFLSWYSVTAQLTQQGTARLESLLAASTSEMARRLDFLADDIRRRSGRLTGCAGQPRSMCLDDLLYGVEELSAFSGPLPDSLIGSGSARLAPGEFRLVVGPGDIAAPKLYLGYRPDSRDASLLLRLDREYVWGTVDQESLPEGIRFSLSEQKDGGRFLFGSGSRGSDEDLTVALPMAESEGIRLPALEAAVSEPLSQVLQPLQVFRRLFPPVLGLALLLPVILTLRQLRRNLAPLEELTAATGRIADGDFLTPVKVAAGDEFESLGKAFNTMGSQLGRQFQALDTSAEIDRAILSATDFSTIARIVLERVPEVFACKAVSLSIAEMAGRPGETLVAAPGEPHTPVPAPALPDDITPMSWLAGAGGDPLPDYLAHLASPDTEVRITAYPLRFSGELLGLLALRIDPERPPAEALPFLVRMVDQFAVALANIRMMEQVRRLAYYDTVTGLPNRAHYHLRLAAALKSRSTPEERVAVCSIDLNQFARINGTLGHRSGDYLLHEVGRRFAAALGQERVPPPESAKVGREAGRVLFHLGADKFAIIAWGKAAREAARTAAETLLRELATPFRLGPEEVVIGASAGIAVFPLDASDGESLHQHAEVSLSYAKAENRRSGGEAIRSYQPAMGSERLARLKLEGDLRKGLERQEFQMFYQPIVDLASGHIIEAEALVRWARPGRGVLSPGDFIGCCEETGLILPLGEWILQEVCNQLGRWEDRGHRLIDRISVNISGRQFLQNGIVELVSGTLSAASVDPERLGLELTETCLMEGTVDSERKIRALAELGITLAIDDFGTGYSSLAYLKHFPVSTLKIDRSFIEGLPGSQDSAALAGAAIALGHAMDMAIVAEGVETRAQAVFLRKRGCHKGQGYLFGQPLTASQFAEAVRRSRLRAG